MKKALKVLSVFIAFKAIVFLAYLVYEHFPVQLIHFEHFAIEDVEFNDIFYLTRGKNDIHLNQQKEVVLINTGSIRADGTFRLGIAELIQKISFFKPAAMGIDILFDPGKKTIFDSTLMREIASHSDIVLATDKNAPGRQMFAAKTTGIVNFPISKNHEETVREYFNYTLNGKDTLFSLAFQLARKCIRNLTPEAPQEYLKYSSVSGGYYDVFNEKKEILCNFPAIEAIDILNDRDTSIFRRLIENKIILIGHLGTGSMFSPWDIEDKYMVPVDSSLIHRRLLMPGVAIHANVVQALLNDDRLIEIKGLRYELINDFILLLFLLLFSTIHHSFILHKTINLLIILVTTIPIIFILGPWLMSVGIYYLTGTLFLQIAFLEEFLDVANGFIKKYQKRKER